MKTVPEPRLNTGGRRRLLLVEDDASVLASLDLCLSPDYEIHSASTVRSGVDLFKALRPSLVVLDLRLSDGDGLEALREIRGAGATTPVVVLTGYASMHSVEKALRLGASDYLHKPFDGYALKLRIDELTVQNFVNQPARDDLSRYQASESERILELEFRAHASAMFLHDAGNPMMTALTATHVLSRAMKAAPSKYGEDGRD